MSSNADSSEETHSSEEGHSSQDSGSEEGHSSQDDTSEEGDESSESTESETGSNVPGSDNDNDSNKLRSLKPITRQTYDDLRIDEELRRPSMDYMERIQNYIDADTRAMVIDYLITVAEHFMLPPDTLFLAVNYIDRYLSIHAIPEVQLQLLGVTCLMIAAKYEDSNAPQVEEFSGVTLVFFFKKQILDMEQDVRSFFNSELEAPTIRSFLGGFINVAKVTSKVSLKELEYLAEYLAELSLLDYTMLRYPPSLIAASAVFMAKLILLPRKKPWNPTHRYYSGYQASQLRACVEALHGLFRGSRQNKHAEAIRNKYENDEYQKKRHLLDRYPSPIPPEFFED